MLLCSCHRIVWLISTDYYAVLYQHVQTTAEQPLHNLIFVTSTSMRNVRYTTNNLSKHVLNNCQSQAISFYEFLLSIFQQSLKRYNYFDTGYKQLKLSWNLRILIYWTIFWRKFRPALYVGKGGVNNFEFLRRGDGRKIQENYHHVWFFFKETRFIWISLFEFL